MSRELVLNQSIARIVAKENKLLATKLMMDANLSPQLFFQTGFQQGLQQGIDQGFQQGIQRALGVEPRAEGGPVESGKEYLVGEKGKETYVPSPYFEGSIGRDADNNIVTESFFDTGKGRTSDSYEIKGSDGKVRFSRNLDMTGSAIKETYYDHYSNTETFDDGSAETFTETANMSSRSVDIGIPDLIEHKDQLLGEIHKIKGFENVTIEDVIKGQTGLDDNTLFDVLANSDASYATAAKREAAAKMDLEARGIKPGEGFSTYGERANTDEWYLDEGDEVSQSLKGTVGYRQGQINPASLFNASSTLKEESELKFNSEGIQPSKEESNQFASLADSINQSVNSSNVRTVIQPVIQTQIQQVSQPVPMSSSSVEVVRVDKSQLPTSIAKMIN